MMIVVEVGRARVVVKKQIVMAVELGRNGVVVKKLLLSLLMVEVVVVV